MKNSKHSTNGFQSRAVHNLIILDESGSMESIKQATIVGFNEIVQTIKGTEKQFSEQEHFVSLVTFNGLGLKSKLFNKKARALQELDERSFQPDASTPLFDAIGYSIARLRKEIGPAKDVSVLVTILTDGEENASTEFSGLAVQRLISEMKSKGWTFTYIGANHNVEELAYSLAITNSIKFESNAEDVKRVFDVDKKARRVHAMKLRRGDNAQANYFEDADTEPGIQD
jgi:hypothetical protein